MNQSIELLTQAITTTIKAVKRDGATAMSIGNLKQMTPTRGLTCSPAEYHRMFPEIAVSVARKLRFPLIND